MSEGQLFLLSVIVTIFACGMWAGWTAGRQHEKAKRIIKRVRARRDTAAGVTREP